MGQGDRVVADGLLVQHPVPTVFFVAPPLDKLLFRELGHRLAESAFIVIPADLGLHCLADVVPVLVIPVLQYFEDMRPVAALRRLVFAAGIAACRFRFFALLGSGSTNSLGDLLKLRVFRGDIRDSVGYS
jgi:hypothetical protein